MVAAMKAFKVYFASIKNLDINDATEYTLRGALENLLKSIAEQENSKIRVIHEAKRDIRGRIAPDFKFKLNEAILGYLENKRIGENLDDTLKSEQIEKYKQLSSNILLTNYLEWIWLKDGHVTKRETLCCLNDVEYHKTRLDPDRVEKVNELVASFYSTPSEKITTARVLSLALAVRCHKLQNFLLTELQHQNKEQQEGRLYGLYRVFKGEVFHELEIKEFADAFAQMLGYGLFLAKLNAGENTAVTLQNAKTHIPSNFELIRELVDFLDELEKSEYRDIKWLVEEILGIMNTLDLAAIQEDLVFTRRQNGQFPPTEEERLLFAKDPYIYFYEDFLKAYDKETRKGRGVYYTPPPVVNFIIRATNDILKEIFGISQGLADRKRVTVLDFATGTGTFLREVLQQILEEVSEGVRNQVIQEHVLKNVYGFEYLIAPYTIAHLKLSQFLQDKGYRMQPDERLQIYLTNTLERAELRPVQYSLALVPALSKEIKEAQKIKEKPILVITGNPPYSGHSKNPSERKVVDTTNSQKIRIKREKTFIGDLIETYKHVDGEKLKENSKWLQNDYVKFIRFAQWKMESVEEGIVGIITDHSFLDNPTFRGMRQSLMQSFNQIYLLDLHGNARKKEKTPEGSKDENVFDIEQGVAISLLVKQKGLSRAIYHADLWGMRKDKYRALLEAKRDSLEWQKLTPNMPSYLFIPQNEELREEYEQGWNLKDIFIVNNSGIVSKRDAIAFHFRQEDLRGVLDDFYSLEEQILKEKYNFKESRDGKINFVKKHIRDYGIKDEYIRLCLYRPFDCRWTYHTNKSKGFLGWPVYEIMHHMFSRENVGLGVSKGKEASGVWGHIFCTNQIIQHHTVSLKEINYLFPLYLYPPQEGEKKLKTHWFEESDPFELYGDPAHGNRIENLSPAFRQFVNTHYSYAYSPEEILGYIYAVLHSPTYRERYLEFLKIDFPRISLVDKREIFEALSKLGCELVQAHLLKSIPEEPKVDVTKGEFEVEKPTYNAQHERLYINKEQHFSPVSQDVWDFHIGGYQVLNKYLKSRIGRALSLDEIENVQNAIKVLGFTQRQMQKIEKIWQSELL